MPEDDTPCPVCGTAAARLTVSGSLADTELSRLCAAVPELLAAGAHEVVLCDVESEVAPDLSTVNGVARLHLSAKRLGCVVRVCAQGAALRELLALAGLAEHVTSAPTAAGAPAMDDR